MTESLRNTVALLVIVLVLALVSGYFTDWVLPNQRAEFEQRREETLADLAELRRMEAEAEAASTLASELGLYKEYPYRTVSATYATDWLVDFLAPTTGRDYEQLELSPEAFRQLPLSTVSTYSINGEASFDEIYELVWRVENEPLLHKINQIRLSGDRYSTAVMFELILEAYHDEALAGFFSDSLALEAPEDSLALEEPDDNPFRPLVIAPPPSPTNPDLVDVRMATLVAIAGGRAVFRDASGVVMLQQGDLVASGTIESVDQDSREVVVLLRENGTQRRLTLSLNQ